MKKVMLVFGTRLSNKKVLKMRVKFPVVSCGSKL